MEFVRILDLVPDFPSLSCPHNPHSHSFPYPHWCRREEGCPGVITCSREYLRGTFEWSFRGMRQGVQWTGRWDELWVLQEPQTRCTYPRFYLVRRSPRPLFPLFSRPGTYPVSITGGPPPLPYSSPTTLGPGSVPGRPTCQETQPATWFRYL